MSENMQFCQAFGVRQSGDPLLSEMFGDFKPKIDDPTIHRHRSAHRYTKIRLRSH
ncbi:hypothetical protein KIN20_001612 [Parelaphostrongylus tenuis]|uniref:Uncharacterized protein n=1 Tax=Parelaphostrongylus tenuis TaxID=148309 RepID=A0AAD5QGA3_PARTN|nr:hypothetical protein KIN20_001612 [Parelaphostrongylus tenuis]